MRFFDNLDISSCFLYHRNANAYRWLFYSRYTVTKQTYLEQKLHTYLFQNFVMKMQTILFKNNLHTQIKKIESEDAISELESVYYIYTVNQRTTYTIHNSELNWHFPDKYSRKIGISLRGFTFTFPNLLDLLKNQIEPSQDLINKERNTEETSSVPTQNSFFPEQKASEDSIKNYKNAPISSFINESYFFYNKSDLIKETFITALNKKILIYGSISFFNKKTENEIFKIVSPEEHLKSFVNRNTTKNSLSFQLTNINGNIPKLKDEKIYNLSLIKIGEKRKRQMSKPV